MYPSITAKVLLANGYDPLDDFQLANDSGTVSLFWNHADPQPTEQQINDWATDVSPLPSGQLFSAWLAEHGGNQQLTLKRLAKEYHTDLQAQNVALKVVVKLMVDEINTLRQWAMDMKAATDAATSLATFKTGVAALPAMPDRTYAQATTAIEALIDGE